MYCIIKCTVRGNQARVKNTDLRHPSCTVVMYRRKSVSPVHNVLTCPRLHIKENISYCIGVKQQIRSIFLRSEYIIFI